MDAADLPRPTPRPFFGRTEAVAEIDRILDAARRGKGEGLLLAGPGGIGKSELLNFAAARAVEGGFRVARARALPEELPPPFALLRDLFRSIEAGEDGSFAESDLLPPLGAGASTPEPGGGSATAAPSEAAERPDELERLLAPLGRSGVEGLAAVRDQLYARLAERFLGLAERGPVLVCVDDLHLADRSSIDFLRRLGEDLPSSRIALLGTVAAASELDAGARELLARSFPTPPFRSVSIRPLSLAEFRAYVTWLLGIDAASSDEVVRWHAETEGNPFLAELLVRSAAGSERPTAPGPRPGLASGLAILRARALALSDGDRRLLTYAAVLGREFEFPTLAAVAGGGEERGTEGLDRLVRTGLLRERGGEIYEFVSEPLRASLYAELTETRRRILHQKVGVALEATHRASDTDLARHFYLGRNDAKAVEYSLSAAGAAARAYAFDTALAHVERALVAERRRPDRDRTRELRLMIEEGRLLDETGNLPRAGEVLEQAVALGRLPPHLDLELGRALIGLATTRVDRSDYAAAVPLATEAGELFHNGGTPRDMFSVHRTLGTVYWRLADFRKAEAHQRAALEFAEKEGTPLEHGHTLVDVANTLTPRGREFFEPARALYEKAAELFTASGDFGARARVLMNRAVLVYWTGDLEEALREIRVALEAAERSRSPVWIGYCLLNLAELETATGQPERARQAVERAEAVLAPLGDRMAEQQLAMIRGMIAEAENRLDDAESHFRDALNRARAMPVAAETAEMLYRLARLFHRRRNDGEARKHLDEAKRAGLDALRPDLAPRARELDAELPSGP